jgi:hypothetical protein
MATFSNITDKFDSILVDLCSHVATHLKVDEESVKKAFLSYGKKTVKKEVVEAKKADPKAKSKEDEKATPKKADPKAKSQKDPKEEPKKTPSAKSKASLKSDSDSEEKPSVAKGKSAGKSKTPEKLTCGWMINGENPCGKNAKVEQVIDNVYYCGTENSGHYKSALAKSKTVKKDEKGAKSKGLEVSEAAVNKIMGKQSIHISKNKNGLYVHPESGIVFEKDTHTAYGVLDKDGKTVKALTDKEKKFIEKHTMLVDESLRKKYAKKISDKEPDVEENEDPQSDKESESEQVQLTLEAEEDSQSEPAEEEEEIDVPDDDDGEAVEPEEEEDVEDDD